MISEVSAFSDRNDLRHCELILSVARLINGSPRYAQKMRQHHADFTVARHNYNAGGTLLHTSSYSIFEILVPEIKELSIEDFLHIQGIERSLKESKSAASASHPGALGPFVSKEHYLNRRIRALIEEFTINAENNADARLMTATYALCDLKVTVLVRAAKIPSLSRGINTDANSEGCFSDNDVHFRCLDVITKVAKVCLSCLSTPAAIITYRTVFSLRKMNCRSTCRLVYTSTRSTPADFGYCKLANPDSGKLWISAWSTKQLFHCITFCIIAVMQ